MENMDLNLTNEKRILLRAAQLQRPVNGTLELLPLCNMNCDMCYIRRDRSEVESGGGLRTAEEWIELGEEMRKAGVLFLLLTGIEADGYGFDNQYKRYAS